MAAGKHHRGQREANVAKIFALRAEGRTGPEIAAQLGLSLKTIHGYVNDPTGEATARRRIKHKAKYAGTCEVCGAVTHGKRKDVIPTRCVRHPRGHPVWTKERIIEAIQRWAFTFGEPPASSDWNSYHCEQLNDPERAARFRRLHKAGLVPGYTAVYYQFGSWGAAIEAAGYTPLPAHGGSEQAQRRRREAGERRANRPGIVLHTAQR